MKSNLKTHFARNNSAVAAGLCVLTALISTSAWAQSPVVMVEEHWELKVADPDSGSSAPQTSMVMSPTGDSEDLFFIFTLNHRSAPDYAAGGLQVQMWHGDDLEDDRSSNEQGALRHENETVTWVQRLELSENQLTFGIHSGNSESWGTFGGSDMKLSTTTNLSSLSAYRPAVSLTESQVGFAENRVESLVLKKLVWKTADGQVHEQNAPIPIDTSLE